MKKHYLFAVLISLSIANSNAQFIDDMESYTDGEPIFGAHWTDLGCGGGVGCALMSSSDESHSGSLSGLIPNDTTTDAGLDLGGKIFGVWNLEFWMYIPSNKEAYFSIIGSLPVAEPPNVGHFYFNLNNNNPGQGIIQDIAIGDVIFNFPHDEWFRINMRVDISTGMSNATWQLFIDDIEIVTCETPFTDEDGISPTSLGGINFFSISGLSTYYLDDFYYSDPEYTCLLGFKDDKKRDFSIYPNPVKDNLTIENTSPSQITSIKVYDAIGRLVMEEEGNVKQLNVSSLNTGLLFIEIETDERVFTKKVIKE